MSRKQGPRASGDAPGRECCPPPTRRGWKLDGSQGGGAMTGTLDSRASRNTFP